MPSDVTGPSWSDIADWYDELLVAGSGPHEHALTCLDRLLPPIVQGTEALDVACGQGIVTGTPSAVRTSRPAPRLMTATLAT